MKKVLPDNPGLKQRHKQLLEYISDSWLLLGIAMGCMIVVAATTAATAFLVKPVLDEIFMQKNTAMLMVLPVVVMVLYICRGIAMYGQEYLMKYVGERIIKRLRDNLYDRIIELPLDFFQQSKTGVLMARITNDVNIIKTAKVI